MKVVHVTTMQVLTVLPRYIICNQSEEALDFAQIGASTSWRLPPGGIRHPWHWTDVEVFDQFLTNAIKTTQSERCP